MKPGGRKEQAAMGRLGNLWRAWRWRRKRQFRLLRAFRKRGELVPVIDRTADIAPGAIVLFCTFRNEALRLPYFLEHYRSLGVGHFIFVDNASDDGGAALLLGQGDVSLWQTGASYRASRYGMDWLQWLLIRHGHGRWCLTVDADELLVYPHHETRPLPALTGWLDDSGIASFGALMLDMYPKGPVDRAPYQPGQDPTEVLQWYDRANYTIIRKQDLHYLWIQGGVRSRMFLHGEPRRGPTLSKIPLVKWHRGYVYLNSTHSMLPRRLNNVYDAAGGELLSGVLLHTKFLPTISAKSAEEKQRRQHFGEPGAFDHYYDALTAGPDLWCEASTRYLGWRQLEAEGLMSRGEWG
ncbi:glycosyltransferase family 2 protein [Pararhodobacter sp.]|uniref:glycosyltransferase family 2 protein n=1 Tax=Pararhodobacter sp. TaxID=2127056 RepID=UPI002FDCDDDB